jgi:carbonic anhydrase
MNFRIAAAAFALLTASAQAAGSGYDYDQVDLWNLQFNNAAAGEFCGGAKQSPIALKSMDCTHYANYDFDAGDCGLNDFDYDIDANGVRLGYKTINTTCTPAKFTIPVNSISDDPDKFVGGATYVHIQSHIHLSSEHTIDGAYYGAELHMVHATDGAGDRLAVLGTMIRPVLPYDNPQFEHFLKRWTMLREADDCDCIEHFEFETDDSVEIDVYENMQGKDFYHYDGGLTTPTCDERVWWNFNTESWNISVRQFQVMTDIILNHKKLDAVTGECVLTTNASLGGSTSRPPQPLNGRKVIKVCNFS